MATADRLTHYVPYFGEASPSRGLRRTACGTHVFMAAHSVTPTCPACRAWLENDDAEGAKMLEAWTPEADAAARLARGDR